MPSCGQQTDDIFLRGGKEGAYGPVLGSKSHNIFWHGTNCQKEWQGARFFLYRDSASTVTKNFVFLVFSLELLNRFGSDFDRIVREV